jgi:preflagellin peptidase FlaK
MAEIFALTGLIVLTAVLISASVHDLRSREVPDIHWVAVCATGLLILLSVMSDGPITVQRIMIFIAAAMVVIDILHDRECSLYIDVMFYAALAVMFIIPMATAHDDSFIRYASAIPVCYVLFLTLFFTGVIKGGADVKCLISVSMIFPVYPVICGLPMIGVPPGIISNIISFPLTVLLYASLFSVFAVIPIAIRNVIRGDTELPNMFLGYRMDAADAEKAHVWPMDGVGTHRSSDDSGEMIWVTPKVPFIVPITAAVLFAAVAGNVLFLI